MSNTSFTPIIIPDVRYGITNDGMPLLLDIVRPEPHRSALSSFKTAHSR